jgi:hypothetical protein
MKTFLLAMTIFTSVVGFAAGDRLTETRLGYHLIRVDAVTGTILPWQAGGLGDAYDETLQRVWRFWKGMGLDRNGVPYFMNHQVWRAEFPDKRGAGGDQFAMALSSLRLLYPFLGDENVKEEMKVIADQYLARSLSPRSCAWPDLPFPYNTLIFSGVYDGDMVLGPGITQPDKAGSFGFELVKLYEMTENGRYLDAARRIADTLAAHVRQGDHDRSPWPFKVDVYSGEPAKLLSNEIDQNDTAKFAARPSVGIADYTTNYAGTVQLFAELEKRGVGNVPAYRRARELTVAWMQEFPVKNNRWGPFFEDIPGWSDTQINAVTWAEYMMEHRDLFPEWKSQVRGILDWVYSKLGDDEWAPYGVKVVREQTAYEVPGNSHTSRQASAELRYAELTGDMMWKTNAIRQLNWATYMVDHDGKNRYPRDDIWLTDGYGDYVRHYLRAMAAAPELAPSGRDRILRTSSPIVLAEYAPDIQRFGFPPKSADFIQRVLVHYVATENVSDEMLRLRKKPEQVTVDDRVLIETTDGMKEGWEWRPLGEGGLLIVRHRTGREIAIFGP